MFDTQKKSTPIQFISNNQEIKVSTINNVKYLLNLTGQERDQTRQVWDKHTVFQLNRLVTHYKALLTFPYGLHCYSVYEPMANHKGRSTDFFSDIGTLGIGFRVDSNKIRDETSALFVHPSDDTCLFQHSYIEKKDNDKCSNLAMLCNFTNLLYPNDMQVEGGFNDMKMTETLHKANLTLPTYNVMRHVGSYFKDIKYETFVIPQSLVKV